MGKKIAALIVALLVIVFPFRRAFLSDQEPGLMMMLSFIITLAGIVVFYYLTITKHEDQKSH
jgi:purine-cytosine permease-like protein